MYFYYKHNNKQVYKNEGRTEMFLGGEGGWRASEKEGVGEMELYRCLVST